ncbi:MAG: UDP-N-acetylmuramoyl-L-alanine--D-glutamate ligase [Patescibacteria group bacterium]|jgi:UDP-N-acetylmuramoylalanine--D-glutamate ligase
MTSFETQSGKIAILGFGREGLDLLRFFHKLKVKPVVLNDTEILSTHPAYREIQKFASAVRTGTGYLKGLADFDLVFRSPGVPLDLAAIKQAARQGVTLSSLTKLFFDLCPAKIIGVTGTKGKSTTAALIYHLLKGKTKGKAYFGGNIGYPPLQLLTKLTKQDVIVLELSSFQLEDLTKSPQVAVLLGIAPEHLDRHKTFKKYMAAKLNLVRYQNKNDFTVVSADEAISAVVAKTTKGKIIKYSSRKILPRGVYLAGEEIIYRHVRTGHRQVVIQAQNVPLLGQHNLGNVLAALTVALLLEVPLARIQRQIKTFSGLEHRLELVGHKHKVQFIDDSLATTPVATMAAIQTLTGPISLILGGSTKKEKFTELVRLLITKDIQGVVLIGATAPVLEKSFKTAKVKFPFMKAADFPSAVRQAYRYAAPEGTVLLSPACASFGWFRDAYDRGAQFKQLVEQIISGK